MSARTARDVIDAVIYFENDNMGMSNETTIGETFGADAILSALHSAGFAVVPVEPTEGMYLATCDAWEYHGSGFDQFKREYQALLKAAQEDSRE
jgi:hypothetical protein